MCIALISTAHPDYPLVLIDNRDEYLNRPTALAAWWSPPNEHVLAGHDLLRNVHGTWLGVTKDGRVAVLTNFREEGEVVQGAVSRGAMVNAFLTPAPGDAAGTEKFVRKLVEGEGVKGVGGFSLVCGKIGEPLAVVSNRTPNVEGVTWIATSKSETVGLSNAAYGDRSWPKVVQGEALMTSTITKSIAAGHSKDQFVEEMMHVLSTDTLPKRGEDEGWDSYVLELRNSIFVPPIGGEGMDGVRADDIAAGKGGQNVHNVDRGKPTSNIVGMSGIYGTLKQSVVLVDKKGQVTFVERTLYDDMARPLSISERDQKFEFATQG